jgi:hypothetical protein
MKMVPKLTAETILQLTDQEPDSSRVVALSQSRKIALATVVTNDGREDLIAFGEFRWSEDHGWQLQDLDPQEDVAVIVGQFPGYAGRPELRAEVAGRGIGIPISPGGWYAYVEHVGSGESRQIKLLDYP